MTHMDLIRTSQREIMTELVRSEVSMSHSAPVREAVLERAARALLVAAVVVSGGVDAGTEVEIPTAALEWPAAFGREFGSEVWFVVERDGGFAVDGEFRVEGVSLQDFVARNEDGKEFRVPWDEVGETAFFRESDARATAARRNRLSRTPR